MSLILTYWNEIEPLALQCTTFTVRILDPAKGIFPLCPATLLCDMPPDDADGLVLVG